MDVLVNQKGSIDDIRNSLKHLNPKNNKEAKKILDYLNSSWDDEIRHKGRKTVLLLIDAKTNQIYRKWKGIV